MTNASDYQRLIEGRKLLDEASADIVEMIDLLANERINFRAGLGSMTDTNQDKQYDFAAKVICIIFDPFKSDNYTTQIQTIRLRFKGIAKNKDQGNRFKNSFELRLLSEVDEREIYSLVDKFGIGQIFKAEYETN